MNYFKSLVFAVSFSVLSLNCGEDPTSPGTSGDPAKNISATYEKQDTINSAMLVMGAKFASDSEGLVTFHLTNNNSESYTFNLSATITGYSSEAKKTILIPGNTTKSIALTPIMLSSEFKTLTELKTVAYNLVATADVNGQTKNLINETPSAILTARDVMDWNYPVLIAGWVTPHAGAIDTLIRLAAARHPGNTLVGYQGSGDQRSIVSAQAEAIYNSLKSDYSVVYINSPTSYPAGTQKVRFPADGLGLASANCIDGTVIFASALENIGIRPVIVLIPGHAFVAWRFWSDNDSVDVLETTMISTSTFQEANDQGITEFNEQISNGNFQSGASKLIDIAELRAKGYTPLMKRAIQ